MQNLEIKRLTTEKKDAVAAQYAAEATLRRVYANQKDDDSLTLASVIAPLEAEIKIYKNEVRAMKLIMNYICHSTLPKFSHIFVPFRWHYCKRIRKLWSV